MGHNGCDSSQASGPWAIGSGYRFSTAGAGSGRDLLYGSRGVPAPYRRTGDLGPHEPCPRTPRVQIVESVESTPDLEAPEERRCSERRALVGHGLDMEDLASICERQCRKACNLRSAAEELEETGSNGRARRYRKRGSPKPAAEARALGTDPSPVRLWSAALRGLSDRLPFGVGGNGQTAHKGAHGPRTRPGA